MSTGTLSLLRKVRASATSRNFCKDRDIIPDKKKTNNNNYTSRPSIAILIYFYRPILNRRGLSPSETDNFWADYFWTREGSEGTVPAGRLCLPETGVGHPG